MNTQPITFFMNRKAFNKLMAIYAHPTPKGRMYLMWQKIMYGLMLFMLIGFPILLALTGITEISMILLLTVLCVPMMSLIPFVVSTFFGVAAVHRTNYYMSPVMDPTLALAEDHLEFHYKDIRDVDWHPSRVMEYAIRYQDIGCVTVNRNTKLVEIQAPYTFKIYSDRYRSDEANVPGRDVYAERGAVSFFDAFVDSDAFFEALKQKGAEINYTEHETNPS